MHISKQSAQQIVNEISTIIKQHINMMDAKGYIIASTDASRVGNFHEGAKKIIDDHLQEYYVTPEAETLSTRTGVNLPIMINGETIGVVGITGEYEQVFNYGQIVKKMTEILVRESYAREQERFDKKFESRFLEEWILGTSEEFSNALIERGISLHIDIAQPRRAMVVRIDKFQELASTGEGLKLIEKIEEAVHQFICKVKGNVYLRLTTKQICLVLPRSDTQMRALAQQLAQQIQNVFGVGILVGIDNGADGTADVRGAYAKANKAAHACLAPIHCIMLYDQINMEIFMEDIPKVLKQEYLRKIFVDCSFEKMCNWIGILEAYFTAEGSINLAAEKLFMHKNTLQYKLKKLEECTGYDVRLPSNCSIFYIAILFFRDVEKDLIIFGN